MAACTSSAPIAGLPDLVAETPDRIDAMSCRAALEDVCRNCDLTLEAALQDRQSFCRPGMPGTVEICGGFHVVTQPGIEGATAYYYRDGRLTATVGPGPADGIVCTAGPPMFDVPHCNHEHAVVLPACATN